MTGFGSLPANLRKRIRLDNSGCWLWTGFCHNGYGRASLAAFPGEQLAHRIVYIALRGPIPRHMVCDHLCEVRNCVNPAHIQIVTNWENVRRSLTNPFAKRARMAFERITHCKHGHEYTPENTLPSGPGGKYRQCRICRRRYERELYARKRSKAAA